jgi:cell division transport system permease protein
LIGDVASDLAFILGALTVILLAAAIALTSIWVHLEIYRHADELTIMRLIGATEWAIRGPFLVAVVIPGVVAAGLSVAGTVVVIGALAELAEAVGLPPVELSAWVVLLQVGVGILLPLLAGVFTLARHARLELDT